MAFAAKLQKLRADVNAAVDLCNGLGGKAEKAKGAAAPTPLPELLEHVVDACRAHRKRKREAAGSNTVDASGIRTHTVWSMLTCPRIYQSQVRLSPAEWLAPPVTAS